MITLDNNLEVTVYWYMNINVYVFVYFCDQVLCS